jgi:hypothetical protein
MRTRPVPVPRRIDLVFRLLAMGIGLLAAGILIGLFPSVGLLLIGGGVTLLAAAFLLLVAMALFVFIAVASRNDVRWPLRLSSEGPLLNLHHVLGV